MPRQKAQGAPMTIADAGRKGGATTAARHGAEFYREIGRKGGQSTAKAHPDHFAAIGRIGGASTKRLIAKAKRRKPSS